MNEQQKQALQALSDAFTKAYDSGLLDIIQLDCDYPSSINDVVDAVDYVKNERK